MPSAIDTDGSSSPPVALVTGASRGLGLALAQGLAARGWRLVVDGRDAAALERAWPAPGTVLLPGDVADPAHRRALAEAGRRLGRLDLLVLNAGTLGPSPLPPLATVPLDAVAETLRVNTVAQLGLVQEVLPLLEASGGAVVAVTSDAAVEAYPGWGAYGAAKAALEAIARVLAAEHPRLPVWAVDPGDLRTRMHQDAFPGEDISDRAEPASVVPAFLALLDRRPASGRYRAADLAAPETTADVPA